MLLLGFILFSWKQFLSFPTYISWIYLNYHDFLLREKSYEVLIWKGMRHKFFIIIIFLVWNTEKQDVHNLKE